MIKRVLYGLSIFVLSTALYADTWLCSGFFISPDGVIATAGHCVVPNAKLTVVYKGQIYKAKVLSDNDGDDSALLKTDIRPEFYYTLQLVIHDGEPVFVLGYPRPEKFGWNLKISSGSGYNVSKGSDGKYNIYAVAFPGNSGGPVVNQKNQVIGILVAGYALPLLGGSTHSLATPIKWLIQVAQTINIKVYLSENTDTIYTKKQIYNIAKQSNSVVIIFGETK